MRNIFCTALIIFFHFKVFNQSNSLEFKAKYEQAKINLKNKKYELAKNELVAMLSNIKSNHYSPYIGYYLALAYYKLNDLQSAENQLLKIQNSSPNWNRNNDLNYLLGIIFLSKKEADKALGKFNKIEEKTYEKSINQQIKSFFNNNKNANEIKLLAAKYPKFKVLKDFEVENKLNIYELSAKEIPILAIRPKQNFSKEIFNIGVLFPFRVDSNQTENNQYIYDMYEGMQIAVEKLKMEQININLRAYDIANSKTEMVKLLHNKQFLENEILIGPLHQESNKIAQYYANESKIGLVNPLSKNSQLYKNKPFSYLNKASNWGYIKQAKKFVEFNFSGESAIVYEKNDSLAAKMLSEEFKKSNAKFTFIKYLNAESINPYLKKKFGSIFVFGQPKTTISIVTNLDKKFGIVPIIINKDFLPDQFNFGGSNNPELYIFNQDFVDESNENIQKFKTDYWEKRNNLTSIYTYKGYDLIIFWGRQLAKFKQGYLDMISIRPSDEDFLVTNFNYSIVPNENVAFTITTIQNGIETFYRKF